MTNKDIDDILSNFQAWDTCGKKECQQFNNFEKAKQKLDEAYGKQFLKLVEKIDPQSGNQVSPVYWGNQLRQAIKDKYLGGSDE